MIRASGFANHFIKGKVLADACWAALVAFLFGLCLGGTLIRQDRLYFTGMALSGVFLILALLWTGRTARRLATSENAKKCARQFLFSCIYFSMLSWTFGIAVSGVIWYSADFIRTFGAVWFGLLTCVAIFPVRRDAKRLNDARPSQITLPG
jgi:integral membrane sensor domain MASE1